MTAGAVDGQHSDLSALVEKIAFALRHGGALTQGDVATLRRMDPNNPQPAFFKLEGLYLEPQLPGDAAARAELETRWAAVIVGLAHLEDLHQRGRRLGFALAEAQFSEIRFARLLRADAQRLVDELPLLARFLAAKGVPADWTAAAQLIFSAGRSDEEALRRHLARDYYGAIARMKHN